MGKRMLQRDKWLALVEEQEKSGLSQKEFCQKRGLKVYQLHYYRHQAKQHKAATMTQASKKLIPIQLKSAQNPAVASGEIRLILSNGLQCVLPGQMEPARVKQLAEVLMSC